MSGMSDYFYNLAAKTFKYEPVRKFKRKLRPLKQAIYGRQGIYEAIDLVKTFEEKAGKKDIITVFDVGAADGEYALTFLDAFPRATIYCFEPQSRSYAKLEEKIAAHKERVRLFKLGLWNKNEKLKIHLMSYEDSSSLLPVVVGEQTIVGTETIPVMRLDDFMKEHDIPHIDFLKIDVESAEAEVIEGAKETLANKVDNVYIEVAFKRGRVYSSNYLKVFNILHDAGFTLIKVMGSGGAPDFFFSKLDK